MADMTENRQEEFWKALKLNDVTKIDGLLQSMKRQELILDINEVNEDHQTPLIAAILSNYTEITSLLLKYGATIIGDTLLYVIKTDSNSMVKLICEHLIKTPSQVMLLPLLNGLSMDSNFKPVSSSLMYAARRNCHDIVKTLVQYGAEIPSLKNVLEYSNKDDSYEQYIASYCWHQSISSEAYLLYASDDPFQAAIDAGKAVQKVKSSQQHHLQSGYKQLTEQLDQFVTKFVKSASTEEEISVLLRKGELEMPGKNDKTGVLPQRVRDSLDLNYKQFISSTACTHYVLDQWYMKWNRLSLLSFILWTIMVIVFQPLMCLAYIILPFKFHRKIMKTPYARFLVHGTSRIYFICFLIKIVSINSLDPVSLVMYLLTYVWVIGRTWREVRECWSVGLKSYWKDFFNYIDIAQLLLYWTSLFLLVKHILPNNVEVVDGLFGIAAVLSSLALLRDLVVVGFVGPLRVSLGAMIKDIIRFFILFILVWISFSLGLTKLYQHYYIICPAGACRNSAFTSLQETLRSLFWSLFTTIDKDSIQVQIESKFKFTSVAGETLYAIYMAVVVVVMLNALIAMMSNTYTRVEENAEIEWKVARTNLMAEFITTSATLPPPFNIFPTLRMIRKWLTAPCRKIHSCCQKPEERNAETVEQQEAAIYKTLVRTLVDRYTISHVTNKETSDIGKLSGEIGELKSALQNSGKESSNLEKLSAEIGEMKASLQKSSKEASNTCDLRKLTAEMIELKASFQNIEHLLANDS